MKKKLTLLASVLVIVWVGITVFSYSSSASTNTSECSDCLQRVTEQYRECQQNYPDNSKCEIYFKIFREECILNYCKGKE